MDNFDIFLTELLKNLSPKTKISIDGNIKNIKAMAHLTTKNYLKTNGDYYKIIFIDNSFMLIIPNDKEIYYADKIIGKIESVTDDMIGNIKVLEYDGKTYELGNKDDYQFVLQLLIGNPYDIEGECRFSDYFPTTGPKEFLSLGWLTRTNERADINCKIINIDKIKIIN